MTESQMSFSHCCRPCLEDRSGLSPWEPFSRDVQQSYVTYISTSLFYTYFPVNYWGFGRLVIFSIHTCSLQEHFHLAPFYTYCGNTGIDGAWNSPADGSNVTLVDANQDNTQQKKKNFCFYGRMPSARKSVQTHVTYCMEWLIDSLATKTIT